MDWRYGDSWEKYPIEQGEIWTAGPHKVMVADITNTDLNPLLQGTTIDMTYIDPPWNTGLLKGFYTKAKVEKHITGYAAFTHKLLETIEKHSPNINYIEIGKQNMNLLIGQIKLRGKITNMWDITYHRKKPAKLIRYTFNNKPPIKLDLNGVDDEYTPNLILHVEKGISTILDLCTGRGLTGKAAHNNQKTFYGVELNKRRLSCLLHHFNKQGLKIQNG